MVQNGQLVNVHYVGTFDDGTEFDNSRIRGETISFEVGAGQMISGFDAATEGMTIGQTKRLMNCSMSGASQRVTLNHGATPLS